MNFFTIKKVHRNIFFISALIFIGASIGGYILWSTENKIGTGRQIASTEKHVFWQERVSKEGAMAAYEEFAASVMDLSNGRQHEEAHTFGGALYQSVGTDGLTTCDSRFDYGCFHEFLGRAIAELGLHSVEELNETCIRLLGEGGAGFCQHGLGHGIQSYFGYSDADFDKAFAVCENLPGNDSAGGCSGGIFMEYNLRSMLADERVIRESNDIFSPCNRLGSKSSISSCYFWLPQWWYERFLTDYDNPEEIYAAMGPQCDLLKDAALVSTCYRGIGNMLLKGDQTRDPKFCNLVSLDQKNRDICWGAVQGK